MDMFLLPDPKKYNFSGDKELKYKNVKKSVRNPVANNLLSKFVFDVYNFGKDNSIKMFLHEAAVKVI